MRIKGNMRNIISMLLQVPLYMCVLLVIMDIYLFTINTDAGITGLIFTAVYAVICAAFFVIRWKKLDRELVKFGIGFDQAQRKLLSEMSVPYVIIDEEGCILWADSEFLRLSGERIKNRQHIDEIIPELNFSVFPPVDGKSEVSFDFREMNFKAHLRSFEMDGLDDGSFWNSEKRRPSGGKSGRAIGIYLYDETLIRKLQKDIQDQELAIGLLYIDNYDEALESIDEVRRSLLTALVNRKINKFFQNYDTVIKNIEKDKYILVFQRQYLEKLKATKFPILDEVRSVNIGNDMSVTISLGIGVRNGTYIRTYDAARAAIDLALGRGGDQVVIKGGENIEYYGGKSGSVEKNTKVKARVKAHALRELIESKDKIFIMGHSMPDIDAFGSAVGVYRIAKGLNKEAHIVLDQITSSLEIMVDRFRNNSDYDGMIISSQQALEAIDPLSIVIVVDVNRPSHTECPELLEKAKQIVVLDHHRQSSEVIANPSLSYIETAASSACEVIAEIIQYIGDDIKLKQIEADAMFAGVMIDSNGFVTKTGIRTFEAAAYLRRCGADVTRIRKAFRTDMPEYLAKARSIASAQMFMGCYALAVCDAEGAASPTVLGAQVANELMDVSNIKASFVFTEYNNMIYVSARSIDEVNVQVVMEKLGGGGHMSVAGAQFTDCTLEEAMDRVRDVLAAMTEGGEI
ncbi:MAG: DHH family phosphoesterase [Lachnospiraceae bacterium]|nr:DHH family phosphoesterase [Lachnospiraceae bacterium]